MLLLGLVHRTRRVRVPLPPERFDEALALFESRERQEELPLRVGDDVNDFLFHPGSVLGGQTCEPFLLGLCRHRRRKPRRQQRAGQDAGGVVHGCYLRAGPRSTVPGFAPVREPFRMTGIPFTNT